MATAFKACSVDGCNGNAHWTAKGVSGMCRSHYRRSREHGSPHGGRTRDGEPMRYLREVVIPFAGSECLTWPYARRSGYGVVNANGRVRAVHQVACEAVHGPRPTVRHEVAHNCGKGGDGCVNPNHIRWATPAANQADRALHGTSNRGERCAASKLTERDVIAIRALCGTMTQKQIADIYGVNYITIGDIHRRKTWSWL